MDEKYVLYRGKDRFVIKCYQDQQFVGSSEYPLDKRQEFLAEVKDFKRYVPRGRILIGYRSADGVMEISDLLIGAGLLVPKKRRELAFAQTI